MVELGPLILAANGCWGVRYVYLMVVRFVASLGGEIDQLENERPSRDDAATAREEVSADDVFQY